MLLNLQQLQSELLFYFNTLSGQGDEPQDFDLWSLRLIFSLMLMKLLCSFLLLIPAPVPPPGTIHKAESSLYPCKCSFNSFISILKSCQAAGGRFKSRKNLLPFLFGATDASKSFTAELCGAQISPIPAISIYAVSKFLPGIQISTPAVGSSSRFGFSRGSCSSKFPPAPGCSPATSIPPPRTQQLQSTGIISHLAFSLDHPSYICCAAAISVKSITT